MKSMTVKNSAARLIVLGLTGVMLVPGESNVPDTEENRREIGHMEDLSIVSDNPEAVAARVIPVAPLAPALLAPGGPTNTPAAPGAPAAAPAPAAPAPAPSAAPAAPAAAPAAGWTPPAADATAKK